MENDERRFYEICRIKMARQFECSPDDIDLIPIIECIKRAIIDNCKSDDYSGPVLNPVTEEEQTAVFGPYGPLIVQKIFSEDPPFYNWVELYEENYLRDFLEQLTERVKKN